MAEFFKILDSNRVQHICRFLLGLSSQAVSSKVTKFLGVYSRCGAADTTGVLILQLFDILTEKAFSASRCEASSRSVARERTLLLLRSRTGYGLEKSTQFLIHGIKPKSVIRHAVSVSDWGNEAFGHLARLCPHPVSRYAST